MESNNSNIIMHLGMISSSTGCLPHHGVRSMVPVHTKSEAIVVAKHDAVARQNGCPRKKPGFVSPQKTDERINPAETGAKDWWTEVSGIRRRRGGEGGEDDGEERLNGCDG